MSDLSNKEIADRLRDAVDYSDRVGHVEQYAQCTLRDKYLTLQQLVLDLASELESNEVCRDCGTDSGVSEGQCGDCWVRDGDPAVEEDGEKKQTLKEVIGLVGGMIDERDWTDYHEDTQVEMDGWNKALKKVRSKLKDMLESEVCECEPHIGVDDDGNCANCGVEKKKFVEIPEEWCGAFELDEAVCWNNKDHTCKGVEDYAKELFKEWYEASGNSEMMQEVMDVVCDIESINVKYGVDLWDVFDEIKDT